VLQDLHSVVAEDVLAIAVVPDAAGRFANRPYSVDECAV
jgi:hypothetical protein